MTDSRDLDWPGTYNVRDLGGLPTRSGGATRRGAFVRAEHLDLLEPAGWMRLHRHGIRTCVDLRSSWELGDDPYADRLPDREVVAVRAPLEEGLLDDPTFRGWAESGELSTARYYEPFLDRWPARVVATVRAIAGAGPGGVLYHCQRGRDRTGLITLVLLSLADVPAEVILADHLRTDERLAERGLALGHVGVEGEADGYAARGTTVEATVVTVLDRLDGRAWLRSAGLGDDELHGLAARLVDR